MKNRPIRLIFVSLFILISAGFLFSTSAWCALLGAITAYLVFRASPFTFAFLAGYSLPVGYSLFKNYSSDISLWFSISPTFFLLLAAVILFHPETLKTLFKPDRRWWLTPFRWQASIPLKLRMLTRECYVHSFDISIGGAFLAFDQNPAHKRRFKAFINPAQSSNFSLRELTIGTQCQVCVPLAGLSFLQCRAEVVRISEQPQGKYPPGLGIRFLGLSWFSQRILASYLEDLTAQTNHEKQKEIQGSKD